MDVQFGVDRFLLEPRSRKCRFAMVTNHAACTAAYVPSRQALLASECKIARLFSPEHGLEAVGPDGRPMAGGIDPLTGVPVVSLYGDKLEPAGDDLADIDAVLVDLPEIGCRCYTYLWTLSKVMEACARWKKPLIVFDRPNPLSGLLSLAEGPMLDEQHCSSFIGRWNIPLRHSCTVGELARYWQASRVPELELEVIPVGGWRRGMFHSIWSHSFVPTSPAITNFEACLLYAGFCLLEATNLSEGRGSPLAFRLAAAPWIDSIAVALAWGELEIAGVVARPAALMPEAGRYCGQACNAVMLHVYDVLAFRPVFSSLTLLRLIRDMHPKHFEWGRYPTHVNPTGEGHLDKILGVHHAEILFDQPLDLFNKSVHRLLDVGAWSKTITPYLLYED